MKQAVNDSHSHCLWLEDPHGTRCSGLCFKSPSLPLDRRGNWSPEHILELYTAGLWWGFFGWFLFCFVFLGWGGWVGWCGLHVANQLPNLEQNTGFFTFRSLHDSQPPPPSNVSADVQLWSRSAVPRATSVPKQQWGFTPSGTCIQPCYSACPPGTARCSVNLLP